VHDGFRTLGLIPARGGSKGLPRKNVLPLAGKPLISWTIVGALSGTLLDRVIVSTDDEEIVAVARDAGADVPFLRPFELATDTSTSAEVALHALDWLKAAGEQDFDYLALLQPTSPLRNPATIDRAISLLASNHENADAVVTVVEAGHGHPLLAKRIDEGGYLRPYDSGSYSTARRQDLPAAYLPCGVVFLCQVPVLCEHRTFYPERILPLVIERWEGWEIDDEMDLVCAEAIVQNRLRGFTHS
jgi:CMP-N-acetylneuraminic acid synthetase